MVARKNIYFFFFVTENWRLRTLVAPKKKIVTEQIFSKYRGSPEKNLS